MLVLSIVHVFREGNYLVERRKHVKISELNLLSRVPGCTAILPSKQDQYLRVYTFSFTVIYSIKHAPQYLWPIIYIFRKG